MTFKHWAKNLPYAGKLVDYKVERAEKLTYEIIKLRKELKNALWELKTLERENEEWLFDEWTLEEMGKAKEKAKVEGFYIDLDSNG